MSVATYYIVREHKREGPFDLVVVIRKIRNANLAPDDMIALDLYSDPEPADTYPELHEVFSEEVESDAPVQEAFTMEPISFGSIIRNGLDHVVQHQSLALIGGFFLLMIAAISSIFGLSTPPIVAAIMVPPLTLCCIHLLAITVIRRVRGQNTSVSLFNELLQKNFLASFVTAWIIAGISFIIPAVLATLITPALGFFAIVPGLAFMAVHIFTPFYIYDHPEFSYLEVLANSREAMLFSGMGGIVVVSLILLLNFFAIGAFLPALILLPVTYAGLAEYYDRNLSR